MLSCEGDDAPVQLRLQHEAASMADLVQQIADALDTDEAEQVEG